MHSRDTSKFTKKIPEKYYKVNCARFNIGCPLCRPLVTSVKIDNISDPEKTIRCDALVDTGASHMVLPINWKDRLGNLGKIGEVEQCQADVDMIGHRLL